MSLRQLLAYLAAAAATIWGVQLMISGEPDDEPTDGPQVTTVDPDKYMERGEDQVRLVRVPLAADGSERPETAVDTLRQEAADEREFRLQQRGPELRERLEDLGGLPVYVEGIDGIEQELKAKEDARRKRR